jgi:hypothetical protein
MGDISKHFNRSEFACKCECGFNTVDVELLEIAEDLREHFGMPIVCNSGCRCETHNAKVGGGKDSQHLRVVGVDPIDVYVYLSDEYPHQYGLGLYDTFVHVDSRSKMARWVKG